MPQGALSGRFWSQNRLLKYNTHPDLVPNDLWFFQNIKSALKYENFCMLKKKKK
jgi:hypothetical protein